MCNWNGAVTLRSLLCFALSSIVVSFLKNTVFLERRERGHFLKFWKSRISRMGPILPARKWSNVMKGTTAVNRRGACSYDILLVFVDWCSQLALATFIQNIHSISFHTRPFNVSLFGSTTIIWVPLSSINWILVYSILFTLICKICSLSSAFHCVVTIQQSVFIKSGFLCLYYSIDQVNNLREIQAMRRLNPHGNVVDLKDVIL